MTSPSSTQKEEYLTEVVAPMRVLIELDVRFARSAPEITGDSKKSMFRIYRDIPSRRTAERSL